MKKDYTKLWTLFKSMFVLSASTFGGGFVIVSLMKKKYVEDLGWPQSTRAIDEGRIPSSAHCTPHVQAHRMHAPRPPPARSPPA